jgi:transposase
MFYQIRNNSFKGEGIVAFLEALIAFAGTKVLLIWDNASFHKSEEIKSFLDTDLGKMLWLVNTPPYCPELNPDELVWSYLKSVEIPNRLAKNITEPNLLVGELLKKA